MNHDLLSSWEAVIGLEVHVELNTKSKLFSQAPNHFGDDPNTNITEVCTGQPGALPVLNQEAVFKAVQFGLAIDAQVAKFSRFDRKSYFYPDSPRNFQITQFDYPIILGGQIVVQVEEEVKRFSVNRVHLEDDAGMLKHFSTFAGVDYNRAGVPLIEIVSEPCIHNAKEATAYVQAIKAILEYLNVSDCNMEEGSLRIDTNISVRKKGETTLRNKIEIKNMNSFTNMEMAIESEVKRQILAYESALDQDPDLIIPQATYRWDPEEKRTILMRNKEKAEDYLYFPEPDLPPIRLTDFYIEEVRTTIPELPFDKTMRYITELGLSDYASKTLTSNKKLADYFEEMLKFSSNARALCNWLTVEFAGRLKESGKTLLDLGIAPHNVAKLVNLIDKGTITGKIAKSVADEMVLYPHKECDQIIAENPDYQAVHDTGEIAKIVEQVLKDNPQSITDFKAGKGRAFDFLVGQIMKHSRGKASPAIVNELLKDQIGKI